MITFKNKIQTLNRFTKEILEIEDVYLSDLIELKKACDAVSDEIDSKYDDVRIELD